VLSWVDQVFQVYECAKEVAAQQLPEVERRRWRCRLEVDLLAVARPCLGDKEALQHPLVQRIERFQSELFTFVQHPGVPPRNNAAERAIRPAVTAREVSGGTRSAKGLKTKMALMTLFGTWLLQGRGCFQACIEMLRGLPTAATAAPT